jgi:hypothetical protein
MLEYVPSPAYGGGEYFRNIEVFTQFQTQADSAAAGGAGVSIPQTFVQVNSLVLGMMETAFADNDALPPTLDLAGPNARVTTTQIGPMAGGQGRISYWLHNMPNPTSGTQDGYAINVSMEQPMPEIAANPNPAKPAQPATTFARFPDLIATFKVGEMQAGSSKTQPQPEYQLWHVQFGSIVRSLGLERGDNSIDESAFGWGLSLSGNYSFFWDPNLKVRDSVYGSVTYGVGIAHYISDLRTPSTSAATSGNDAILDGTYLRPLPDLGYYVGYLHNWTDSWRSTVSYSHVTLESQGQSIKTLYRFGDYVSANIEWHRLVPGLPLDKANNPTQYSFDMGLEYLYGRFEELSGFAGQDQRLSLVTSISK